ncbi:unnamed protein product [Calicophoron daubneyi]|uniref:Uncharacterized protein n=1 Tax=Calicophoron daubneyi TaxID=300641 RepID=A0AAV2TT86_CALDB
MTEQREIPDFIRCTIKPEDCVGENRTKWLCPPGYHPPEFFKCAEPAPQVDQISKPDRRIHWTENLSRVKHPLQRWRPWASDRSGLRILDWDTSEVDCKPPKLGNYEHRPVCLFPPTPLTRYFNELDNLKALHPRYLLERYVYRDPDEYFRKEIEGKEACLLGCDSRAYTPPKPMTKREIMRLRFVTNEYKTFDDWQDDQNDELLADYRKLHDEPIVEKAEQSKPEQLCPP